MKLQDATPPTPFHRKDPIEKHNVRIISASREEKTMTGYHAAAPPAAVLLLATCTANKTTDEEAVRPPPGSWLRSKQLFKGALSPVASQLISN